MPIKSKKRKKRPPRSKVQSVPVLTKLLWKHAGNQTEIAKALGVTRQAVNDYIREHAEELRPILQQAKEQLVDWGEGVLAYHLKTKKSIRAAEFVLSTKGKKRGYTKQIQLAGGDPSEGALPIQILLPDNFRRPAIVNHANGQANAQTPAQIGAAEEGPEPGGPCDDPTATGTADGNPRISG